MNNGQEATGKFLANQPERPGGRRGWMFIWSLVLAAGLAVPGAASGKRAETAAFRLSISADGRRASSGNETLAYSPLWAGNGTGTVTLRQNGDALAEGLDGAGDWAWSAEGNGTYVLTHTVYEDGVAVGEETATFAVAGWGVPFPEGAVGVAPWEGKYDGTGHGVAVRVAEGLEGVSVRYATAAEGPWSGEPPLFTAAGEARTVWCEFSARDYITQTNSAPVRVLPREVTLTSAGASKRYDGEILTAHEVLVGGDGFAEGEGVEYAWTGAQRDVGTSENSFTYTLKEGTKAGNYDISVAFGTLEVAKGAQVIDFPAIGPQTVTNMVQLGATASSGLPVSFEVTDGPGRLDGSELSFTGVGTVTVTATQGGNENWEAAAPVSIAIDVTGFLALTVESAHGTAMPAAGEHDLLLGTEVTARVGGSPEVLGEGLRAVCTGWRLAGNDPKEGTGMEARFTLTNSATLTWLWETQALIQVEALAHGSAEGGGWFALGAEATLTAVPDAGHRFTGWTGAVPGGQAGANPVEWAVTGPGLAVATFYSTYYAREDGDDAADGLSWATAKREIAAALAETAQGDTVVASNGTYGAVSVPSDVMLRSLEGAEVTAIRGGKGTRCVEAASGAVLEGFALEGADVDGDGGGALLESGAELRQCILRGNKAGGVGGGARGGTLENCLLVDNTASSGGGAAGAELRHCTVVRNAGGGAKNCRTVNSVFWMNDGGDVEGGTAAWSLCNPLADGPGNIEGDPCFAGDGIWRLAFESPCIDAASESDLREDLDGDPRPQPKVYGEALKPDMGCYEYVPKARFVWEKGSGTPPYESWKDAAHDIQSALDISGNGDRIVVESGTYGPVTVSNAVYLMGYRGAAETVIDGRGSERAVTLAGGGTLDGFTIRGGASADCGGILADGGATVRNVVVEDCTAEGNGGGLCLYGGSTAENVTARGNTAAYGAGIYATATSTLVRCTMTGNAASVRGGGAWLGGESRMEESVLSENTAPRGAGVYGENVEIAWSEMTANTATTAGGGAAAVFSLFRNNRLSENRAATGGGLHAKDTDGHDCLVTGNAADRGAGVWMEGNGQLWNFTVADNAGPGAGVAANGSTVLGNSIAWGNAGGNIELAGPAEIRHSCSEPLPEGEGNFASAPAFVGDGDYHLRAGSPCVDAGENQPWMPEASDLDGQRRVEAGEEGDGRDIWVDVGADEAANDAVDMPSPGNPRWTWRVVQDARLQLQCAVGLLEGTSWEDLDAPFTATNQAWTLEEPFDGRGMRFYRLIWIRD